MQRIDWLHYPPLPALRAFEATVRLGGFSAAGRALNVTHAAIAQQVRALEAYLGVALVHRDGRRLAVTPEGEQLAAALNDGFGSIGSAVEALRTGGESRPVTITVTPAFATNWLMPRLGRFWASHPDIPISLRPEERVLDLKRERIDLGIRYGMGKWPGVTAEYLTSARYMVVAAPRLIAGRDIGSSGVYRDLPWVFETGWAEQYNWLECCLGLEREALNRTEFATDELALAAARQGYGLHLTSAALVEGDLKDGTLRVIFDSAAENPGYYIVSPTGPMRRPARQFIKWLKESV